MFRCPAILTRILLAVLIVVMLVVVVSMAPAVLAAGGAPGLPNVADPVGVWPLDPEPQVVRGFDPPSDPYGPGHRGVDLAGSVGQAVRTALAGTVAYAGRLAGRGVVVVSHGATRTTYEPVAASVHVGDVLAQGDRIGLLELAGSHCFPAACLRCQFLVRTPEAGCHPFGTAGVPRRCSAMPAARSLRRPHVRARSP